MQPEPEAHATALPNTLSPEQLHLRPGNDGISVSIDPVRAGWRYLSFRAFPLVAGRSLQVGGSEQEVAIVVLSGGGVNVEPGETTPFVLEGRASVFEGLPWAAYLPAGHRARLTPRPIRGDRPVVVALAEAPVAGRPTAARHPLCISPADVQVEVRGAGNATRQVNHIITPDFPADRLLVVEVYTPSGNWSSWPPHKHDRDDLPREAVLEETYCYQFRRPEGWGVQRLYRGDASRDGLWAVRHGDLVLVTDGYHPFVAAHGYDAYYLNTLAGDRRTMACSDDPSLAWTRAAWTDLSPDPRVPLVG